MLRSVERTRADFDRIAALVEDRPDEPDFYEAFLLERIPAGARTILEVGCGTGRLARLLAGRGSAVTAIDLSPEMIRIASARAGAGRRLTFACADLMEHTFDATFDVVLSVATLHHLPFAAAVERMKSLLKPDGILVLHDVRAPSGVLDWIRSGLAALPNGDALRWLVRHGHREPALREAWHDHGATDTYLDIERFRALCREHLPGAEVVRHPLWRYTAVWTA